MNGKINIPILLPMYAKNDQYRRFALMKSRFINKASFLTILFMMLIFGAWAQENRFVYFQTENQTPFYIQKDGKTISSTASGYLILGKMQDGEYPIKLGVLGNSLIQEYLLKVEGVNAGYLIKQVPDMGWALQNLNSGAMQMSSLTPPPQPEDPAPRVAETPNPAVTTNTSAQEPVTGEEVVEPPVIVAETQPVASPTRSLEDSLAAMRREIAARQRYIDSIEQVLKAAEAARVNAPTPPQTPQTEPVNETPPIRETAQNEPRFLDVKPVPMDTVAVERDTLIAIKPIDPAARENPPAAAIETVQATSDSTGTLPKAISGSVENLKAQPDPAPTNPSPAPRVDTAVTPPQANTGNVENLEATPENATQQPAGTPRVTVTTGNTFSTIDRKPCAGIMGRAEVDELMTRASGISDMDSTMRIFRTAFSRNCITTTNLQRIAQYMASDVARYNLFETAYPYTLDYYEFARLESLISDKYYQSKFRELLKR